MMAPPICMHSREGRSPRIYRQSKCPISCSAAARINALQAPRGSKIHTAARYGKRKGLMRISGNRIYTPFFAACVVCAAPACSRQIRIHNCKQNGNRNKPTSPNRRIPTYIASKVSGGYMPIDLPMILGSAISRTIVITAYRRHSPIPSRMLPVANCKSAQGMSTVPVPRMGRISTKEVSAAGAAAFSIPRMEKPIQSCANVSAKIRPYARR